MNGPIYVLGANNKLADMAELVDATDLKSVDNIVRVRFSVSAPFRNLYLMFNIIRKIIRAYWHAVTRPLSDEEYDVERMAL